MTPLIHMWMFCTALEKAKREAAVSDAQKEGDPVILTTVTSACPGSSLRR